MKALFVILLVFPLTISKVDAQNRIIFKNGNFLDCSISMINPDYLSVTTFDERHKKESQYLNYQDIVKIQGPITKSQKRIIEIRNPAIVIEETFIPSGKELDNRSSEYLQLHVGAFDNIVL